MRTLREVRRGAMSAAVALVVAMSGLFVVGSATSASAAMVIPCTEIVSSGDSALPERPGSFEGIKSAALTLDVSYVGFEGLSIHGRTGSPQNPSPYETHHIGDLGRNAVPGTYVFSTTSGNGNFGNPVTTPGTYRADDLLGALQPSSQFPPEQVVHIFDWQQQYNEQPLDSWSIEITYYDCDTDGDGKLDRTDNCDTVVNRDQADLDVDGVGDACDPDADGDGTVDTGDNCRGLSNNQADADGDGIGDECDPSPYPPAPTPTPTPAPSPSPTKAPTTAPVPTTSPTAGPGSPGGPVAGPAPALKERTVVLRYAKKKRVFRGVVASAASSCVQSADVTLWRKHRRSDQRLLMSTVDQQGRFATPEVKRRGAYYATVTSDPAAGCGAARSGTLRIRKR